MKQFIHNAATPQAEFLYSCVAQTIATDLPGEAAFLQCYDRFAERVQQIVDMPASTIDLLFRFLQQNEGALSKRAREKEFAALTEGEAKCIEDIYAQSFNQ
jgi:hypothetical protein